MTLELSESTICIVGGGPAGSVIAIRLADLGHKVCLIERRHLPRKHVGQSITPGVCKQLDFLGISSILVDGVIGRVSYAESLWGDGRVHHRIRQDSGSIVDRGRFDQSLIEHAKRRGVQILEQHKVRRLRRTTSSWSMEVCGPEGIFELTADFVVDAAGRAGILPRTRMRTAPETVALFGGWQGVGLPAHPVIVAGQREWYWSAPMSDGTSCAMVFLAPEFLAERSHSVEQFYQNLVLSSGVLTPANNPSRCGKLIGCDATSYMDTLGADTRSIKVGEAKFAIDPLSSSGVQAAIQSALVASIVVHTIVERPSSSELAVRFYEEHQHAVVGQHSEWASEAYSAVASGASDVFWTSRASRTKAPVRVHTEKQATQIKDIFPHDPIEIAEHVKVVDVPTIVGDFVSCHPAVAAPSLDRAVAFVGGIDLPSLLKDVIPGMTAADVFNDWSARISSAAAYQLLGWCISNDVLRKGQSICRSA